MSRQNTSQENPILAAWRAQFEHARANPFLFQLLLKQYQRILKRLAYFYAQLASLPRRNRRALQRALATSLVGAAMLLALSGAPMVHAASMTVDGTTKADDGKCSLVEAIYNSNSDSQLYVTAGECPAGSGADIITLPTNGTFDYTNHYEPYFALPGITTDITINANNSTISRNAGAVDDFGILAVATASGSLTLNDATVTGGVAYSSFYYFGGGITNYDGTLVLNNCTVTGNSSAVGGGVNTLLGATTINDSNIAYNFAFGGGGLAVINGALTVDNTTVTNNLAVVGGGIANASVDLPNIASQTSNLTLTKSTVTYNIAGLEGGGIFAIGYDDPTVPLPPPKPEIGSAQAPASPKTFEAFLRARGANLNLQDLKAKLGSGALKPGRASGDVKTRPTAARDKDDSPKRDGRKRAHAGSKPERINADTFAITNIAFSTIDDNTAYGYGGGIATDYYTRTYITNTIITNNDAGEGGGVHTSFGEVSIEDSTISYNQALDEDGGGLGNDGGTVTVNRTTVTGNTAVDDGGGLNNRGYGTINVTNSTLTDNSADDDGGGFRNVTGAVSVLENVTIYGNSAGGFGGGVALNDGEITLARTLVSGNTSPFGNEVGSTNYYGSTFNLNDYNLLGHSGETNAQAIYGPVPGATDITATSNGTNPTLLTDILSLALANNGSVIATPAGIVQTLALVANSPAIDQAPNADCSAAPVNGVDQRGLTRNVDDGPPSANDCDIGAYEFGAPTPVNVTGMRGVVNKNGDVVLRWRTTSEAQIAGFNVYRQGKQGEWKQINAKFKSAKHAGNTLGDRYRFTDKNVKPDKTYRYKIEIRYLDGQSEWSRVIRVRTNASDGRE